MRERIVTAKDQGASIAEIAPVLDPTSFKPMQFHLLGWRRSPGVRTFHFFPVGAPAAACGARLTAQHTNITCVNYMLCAGCRDAMAAQATPPAPLSPIMRAILANLRARRPWHEGVVTAPNAWTAFQAYRELCAKKLVKHGAVWITPRGLQRLGDAERKLAAEKQGGTGT